MDIRDFVARWKDSQAAEKANAQSFLNDLCAAIGVEAPQPARNDGADRYVFERRVTLPHEDRPTVGFIDLYKQGSFVLEAKQGSTATSDRLGAAKRGTPQWTQAMQDARGQALGYARVLAEPVPFLIVTDVGYCFDLYACFDGSNFFRPFPTPLESRIFLADLPSKPLVVERLKKVFEDPHSLDPAKQAIKVTREVAGHLARLAKSLEARHPRETVARFLMRCLFTMFAEDVGLLPKKIFEKLLGEYWVPEPDTFVDGVQALWEEMDEGKPNPLVGKLLRFNGGLFRDRSALKLTKDELLVLQLATVCDWSQVEPAIFGTLLERALDPRERHALGAHFTPRAYVERLVRPTVIEPLQDEWRGVRAEVRRLIERQEEKKAAKKLEDFLHRLSTVRVLDPACGSGNFLYVTMDLMKAIESEARKMHDDLGAGFQRVLHEVSPRQFRGIEINPWAKEIAELVLWIGYLQWHFKMYGKGNPPDPVLHDYQNVECRDAMLEYDEKKPRLGPDGQPLWRWDGETMKVSPVTGEKVPDESARTPVFDYVNPRKAQWPTADYVVSNPPYIGNFKMRAELGDGYVEALRAAYPELPESIDLVMYWWDTAAHKVARREIQRAGLITTTSITHTFNRRVVESHLQSDPGISLMFAVADHPWVSAKYEQARKGEAEVRIAMSVLVSGRGKAGSLGRVSVERLRAGEMEATLTVEAGPINANFTIGADVNAAIELMANSGISCPGVKLHGSGFIVTHDEATRLGFGTDTGVGNYLRPYRNGQDLASRPREVFVIDLFGLDADYVRAHVPTLYDWVLRRVKPERDQNNRDSYRKNWWIFGEPRSEFRPALKGLRRYIATPESARRRYFVFLDGSILPDNMIVAVASDDAYHLGVLSSRVHVAWALATGGRLGVRHDPRYNKTRCFETFPFPLPQPTQSAEIRKLAEALDVHRQRQLATHSKLKLTKLYKALALVENNEPLDDADKHAFDEGLGTTLKKIHDDLDAAVLDAYGWPNDLTDEQIVERLVKLNAERAAEERKGIVRWLRPEFQETHAEAAKKPKQQALIEPEAEAETPADGERPEWPKELAERMLAVRSILQRGRSMTAREIAKSFIGAGKTRQQDVQEALVVLRALGQALSIDSGRPAETRWTPAARG